MGEVLEFLANRSCSSEEWGDHQHYFPYASRRKEPSVKDQIIDYLDQKRDSRNFTYLKEFSDILGGSYHVDNKRVWKWADRISLLNGKLREYENNLARLYNAEMISHEEVLKRTSQIKDILEISTKKNGYFMKNYGESYVQGPLGTLDAYTQEYQLIREDPKEHDRIKKTRENLLINMENTRILPERKKSRLEKITEFIKENWWLYRTYP